MKNKNKEYKLDHPLFKIVWGFTNVSNPDSYYISYYTWIEATTEEDINKNINDLKILLRKKIYSRLKKRTKKYYDKFICNFEVPNSGIKLHRKTYLTVDLVVFLQENFKFKVRKDLTIASKEVVKWNEMLSKIFTTQPNFSISKEK